MADTNIVPMSKTCRKCKTEKPFSAFHKNKGERFGIDGECRECASNRRLAPVGKCLVCGSDVPRQPRPDPGARSRRQGVLCSSTCRTKRKLLTTRDWNLRNKYGITEAVFLEMLADQGGKCAICGRADGAGKSFATFAVDHDHRTRKIRGLLCMPCNTGIGALGDSLDVLTRAVEYLRKAETNQCP